MQSRNWNYRAPCVDVKVKIDATTSKDDVVVIVVVVNVDDSSVG